MVDINVHVYKHKTNVKVIKVTLILCEQQTNEKKHYTNITQKKRMKLSLRKAVEEKYHCYYAHFGFLTRTSHIVLHKSKASYIKIGKS